MGIGNPIVSAVLRSPLHRLLSGSIDLITYKGRRSGTLFTTPTQYAKRGAEILILVGRPETKTWWRNFESDRDLSVLVRGRWLPMSGRVVIGANEPETIAPLLDAYLERFPRAGRSLGGTANGRGAQRAVILWCRPRPQ